MSNLGGTFPRFFVLKFVDAFTAATCTPPSVPPAKDLLKGDLITQPFSCVLEAEKHRCIDGGGTCNIQRDGTSLGRISTVLSADLYDRILLCQRPLRTYRSGDVRYVHPTAGAEAAELAYARLADQWWKLICRHIKTN